MKKNVDVLIVGAGIFGVTAALELRRRGHEVCLLDPGPLPHELAASTDISKVLRMEYGADDLYMDWMAEAFEGWKRWNEAWKQAGIGPLFHPTGVLLMAREPMVAGGFEFESFQRLQARGWHPERLDRAAIEKRFPAWSTGCHVDGFFHALGGWAQSGAVVQALLREALALGVDWRPAEMRELLFDQGRVQGVRDIEDGRHLAATVILATGAWTSVLFPELQECFRASGHPVFHLRPDDPDLYRAERFPVFTADVSRTGFYGFPLHPEEGIVKIATHASGRAVDPRADREVSAEDEAALREFLSACLPDLADSPITYRRLCLYSDTRDENFWIDRHPEIEGLVVAAGGSGHGFKFAPLLGSQIADVVEGRSGVMAEKFRWRPEIAEQGREAARFHDSAPASE